MDTPRQYSLVKFNFDNIPEEFHGRYPFSKDDRFIFFGEIPNMMGHCVVANQKTGKLFSGYHIENFVEIDEDEI